MGKRIATVVAGMVVLALLVVAVVALTTETGQAVAAGQDGGSTGEVVQECPSGQDCGGCVLQGSGTAGQETGETPAQDCEGCDAQGDAPAFESDDGGCCQY